jgi:hypothetical protein
MKNVIVLSGCVLVFVVAIAGSAYYLGLQHQAATIQAQQLGRERDYAKAIGSVRTERDRALTDYETACAEYQLLSASYEKLYQKTGAASGLPHYLSPDAARGNEDSCYR